MKRIKELGLEKTLAELESKPAHSFIGDLDWAILKASKQFNFALSYKGNYQLETSAPVVRHTRGLMRMMRSFLERVKLENKSGDASVSSDDTEATAV